MPDATANDDVQMPAPEKKEWTAPTLKKSKVAAETASGGGTGVDGTGSTTIG